jgi:hypothetical protein
MSSTGLIFVGEPNCGKTVLYIRLRHFLSTLVAFQGHLVRRPIDLETAPAQRIRSWLHGQVSPLHALRNIADFRRKDLWYAEGRYIESQATSESLRGLHAMLERGEWPPATRDVDSGIMTLLRRGFMGDHAYHFHLSDYCGEAVALAFPKTGAQAPSRISKGAAQVVAGRDVEAQARTLQEAIALGCGVVFVVDGRALFEGELPEVSERALAAIASLELGQHSVRRRLRLACVVTKRDEIDLAVREGGKGWSAAETMRIRHPSFWNHLQTLGAPCIEVAAVKTSIGASGTRIPRLNPSEFDIGLARIVEWFVLGDCL